MAMPTPALAIKALENLWHIADSLCEDSSCSEFCRHFRWRLSEIIKWRKNLPVGADSKDEAIEMLLEELNNICKVLIDSLNRPVETEMADITTSSLSSPYLSVEQQHHGSSTLREAIFQLASHKKSRLWRKMALASLDSILSDVFYDDEMDTLPSTTHLHVTREGSQEFGKEIISLHKALCSNCGCPESQEMAALIRLSNSSQSNDGKVTFGVLFMVHSHGGPEPGWQDTHISVQPTVKFDHRARAGNEKHTDSDENTVIPAHSDENTVIPADSDENTVIPADSDENIVIPVDSAHKFCAYISGQHVEGPLLLQILVMRQGLRIEGRHPPQRDWDLYSPSISLGQLLEKISLSAGVIADKNKEVLSWLLAKATWQYYKSPWMNQPWNKESVHFLFEEKESDGQQLNFIFMNEPFLSISITSQISKTEKSETGPQDMNPGPQHQKSSVNNKPLHPIPKILALGIMLMEIQLSRPIETLYRDPKWSKYCLRPNQNTNYNICRGLITDPEFFKSISVPLSRLIKGCFETDGVFMPPNTRNDEDIRSALYYFINLLEAYLSNWKPQNVEPLSISQSVPSDYHSITSIPIQTAQLPRRRDGALPPGRTMSQTANTGLTKNWFDHMGRVNYFLKAAKNDTYEKVKIAVLDTGLHPEDATASFISAYRDFIKNDDVPRDNTGHGTTIVNLIFDMCESASVFVARIFDTDQATDETQGLATKVRSFLPRINVSQGPQKFAHDNTNYYCLGY
ncbi:hypothetical protein HDV63DRAFT_388954 [Trichoderma sp. SZMC 28014]